MLRSSWCIYGTVYFIYKGYVHVDWWDGVMLKIVYANMDMHWGKWLNTSQGQWVNAIAALPVELLLLTLSLKKSLGQNFLTFYVQRWFQAWCHSKVPILAQLSLWIIAQCITFLKYVYFGALPHYSPDLTDYTRNVSDVIARKCEINSSKISVVATCLYTAS